MKRHATIILSQSTVKHIAEVFWVLYSLWSSITLTCYQHPSKKFRKLQGNCRCNGQVLMHNSYRHKIASAFLSRNHMTVYKDISMNIKTHETPDTKSSVIKKNFPRKSEPYLRHYFYSFDWRKKKRKSTHKSGINLNNRICQGLTEFTCDKGRNVMPQNCCVSSLLIFDCVWM